MASSALASTLSLYVAPNLLQACYGLTVSAVTHISSESAMCVTLQVHYLQARPAGDESGIRLRMTTKSTPFSAGMINYASYFSIPPGKAQHPVENQCCYSGFETLKGFAFRVHTHALGRSVITSLICPLLCMLVPAVRTVHTHGMTNGHGTIADAFVEILDPILCPKSRECCISLLLCKLCGTLRKGAASDSAQPCLMYYGFAA